jgi:peptidoglycan/xylan/chitin deacetylase (PgdA/CDA1 family)
MLRGIKGAALHTMKAGGLFGLVRDSEWRRKRLLILCYHGISQQDEHLWRPALYLAPQFLEQRLKMLKDGGYAVLPLQDALRRLYESDLPSRSVAITFDDGTYDFYKHGYPLLKSFGFPVTVYQTTYYADYQRPIFNLICSYMLWKRRGSIVHAGKELGLKSPLDLRTSHSRFLVERQLGQNARRDNLNGKQKDEIATALANLLDIDYGELVTRRLLQLMNPTEVTQLAVEGVDFELHTHRHRTPDDELLFRKEINDNRKRIQQITGSIAVHFCYPSGVYAAQFLGWLEAEGVISATTCDAGLATAQTEKLLLPRVVDVSARTAIEFESWLTGAGSLLAFRRKAAQNYSPPSD